MSEQEREPQIVEPVPPPAAEEVKKAGGQQLPGFDEVAERPEDRKPSWTA